MKDRRLIFVAAFLRALATGMAGVLPGLTLRGFRKLKLPEERE